MKEKCLLWEGARRKGEPRGLNLHNECPVEAFCNGSRCIYLSPLDETDLHPVGNFFYTQLEEQLTEEEETKLQNLREELKTLDPEIKEAYLRAFPE
jgi:hypothetical protein